VRMKVARTILDPNRNLSDPESENLSSQRLEKIHLKLGRTE